MAEESPKTEMMWIKSDSFVQTTYDALQLIKHNEGTPAAYMAMGMLELYTHFRKGGSQESFDNKMISMLELLNTNQFPDFLKERLK